jgi:hypothetical protein
MSMATKKQYDKPLMLTSPHMHGVPVRDAQYLMAGNNRFPGLAPYKDGDIDSDYGPLTAQATRNTKFWLGYPLEDCDGVFGQTLYEYLRKRNWRTLPPANRKRRDDRIAAAVETPGLKAFHHAEQFIGYHESPAGSNRNQFGKWMGFDGVPWCAEMVSYCLWLTGWTKMRSAAVFDWDAAGRHGWHRMYLVRQPKRGDLVCFSPNKHISFFDKWLTNSTFQDLGGNTSDGEGWFNGGEVARTRRHTWQVQSYVRIGG